MHLRIDAGDRQLGRAAIQIHVGALTRPDPGEIELVDVRRDFEAGVQRDLTQPVAAVAVLADFQVHGGEPARQRRLDREIAELGAGDGEAALQALHLGVDLRQLLASQYVLALVGLGLQRTQAIVVVELVVDLVGLLAWRIAHGHQGIAPPGHPFQAQDVVVDQGQGLLVVGPVLLQLLLVRLQLGDRFHQAAFLVQHFEFQLDVAELHQRLARRHLIAGLHQHLLHLPALQGVEVDGVPGDHLALQRGQVVEHVRADSVDADRAGRDADAALGLAEEGHGHQEHCGHDDNGAARQTDSGRPPPGPTDPLIHPHAHATRLMIQVCGYASGARNQAKSAS